MFKDKKMADDSILSSKYSLTFVSYNHDFISERKVMDYVNEKTDYSANYYEYFPFVAAHLTYFSKKSQFSHSIAIGNGLGYDFTFSPLEYFYITNSITMTDVMSYQGIIQRRIYDGNPFGLSLGINYQRNNHSVSVGEGVCGTFICGTLFHSSSVGLRSVLFYSDNRPHIRSRMNFFAVFNYSYDMTIGTFYPSLSLSFGIH